MVVSSHLLYDDDLELKEKLAECLLFLDRLEQRLGEKVTWIVGNVFELKLLKEVFNRPKEKTI
ncbi:MAG: hypothetical protein AAF770_02440 [Bacteroidota bacterium]